MNKKNLRKLVKALETTERPFYKGTLWRIKHAFESDKILIPKGQDEPCCAVGLCYLDVMGFRERSTSQIVEQTVYDRVEEFLGTPVGSVYSTNDHSQTHQETALKLKERFNL